MERIKRSLSILPPFTFTLLTLAAIFWLTLAPKPLGEEPPPLFPGADKIAHGIMFGGLVWMVLLDRQRKSLWRQVMPSLAFIFAILASLLGLFIEIAQAEMGLGRGFEYGDIAADTIGAFVFAFLWLTLQKIWITH